VTDTHTHTHTHRHTTTAYTALSKASRGKNSWLTYLLTSNNHTGNCEGCTMCKYYFSIFMFNSHFDI